MPKLPPISGRQLIQLLEKDGFIVLRSRGSHVCLKKNEYVTVVPLHDELARGTLAGILKQCGLTREAFERLRAE